LDEQIAEGVEATVLGESACGATTRTNRGSLHVFRIDDGGS